MSSASRPPGPFAPFDWTGFTLGPAIQLLRDQVGYVRSLSQTYGGIVRFRVLRHETYLVTDPQLVHDVLVTHRQSVSKQTRNVRSIERVLSQGLLTVQGETWRRHRGVLQRSVTTAQLRKYADVCGEIIKRRFDELQDGTTLNLQDEMNSLSMRVISKCFFGYDPHDDAVKWTNAVVSLSLRQMQEVLRAFRLPDWMPLPTQRKKREASKVVRAAVETLLDHHRRDPGDGMNAISQMRAAVAAGTLTLEELIVECTTMLVAGVHTTSAALEWMFLELARHENLQSRVAQEAIDAIETSNWQAYGQSSLENLSYTQMVAQETIRMHPPVWALIAREAKEDFVLGGYKIAAGNYLYMFPLITQNDPRVFDQPDQFRPERFSPDNADEFPRYGYFPFGDGPHICIGAGLAKIMMPMMAADLLRRFQMEPTTSPHDIEPEYATVMFPKQPLVVRLRTRSTSIESERLDRNAEQTATG